MVTCSVGYPVSQSKKNLVSKETVAPRGWGGETGKSGFKRVDREGSNYHCKRITRLAFRVLAVLQSCRMEQRPVNKTVSNQPVRQSVSDIISQYESQ